MERSATKLLNIAFSLDVRSCPLLAHLHRWLTAYKLGRSDVDIKSYEKQAQAKSNLQHEHRPERLSRREFHLSHT
jgi:hypothetical protein